MLVLAGPGSGKTSVLISRLQYLTDTHTARPQEILAVTFTRAAAAEMKERYLKAGKRNATLITFGTLHSVFFAILREAKQTRGKRLFAGKEKQRLLGEILSSLGQDISCREEQVKLLEQEISRIKHAPELLETFVSDVLEPEEFRQAFLLYQTALWECRGMDFDDLAEETLRLFAEHPEVCRQWQQRFSYILVDEFQDIDRQQYALLKLLAKPQNNLFMVGDDDQSIYGFRGADPAVMQQVAADFPSLETVVLDTNYRCERQIIACAERLICHNRLRFAKKISPAKTQDGQLLCLKAPDRRSEWKMIAEDIIREQQSGRLLSDMAVLTRTGKGQEGLQMTLQRLGVSCCLSRKNQRPAASFIWKDLLSYLQLGQGDMQRSTCLRILNRPERYIPRNALRGHLLDWEESIQTADRFVAGRLCQLQREICGLQSLAPAAALYYIRRHIGYEIWLKELAVHQGQDPDVYLAMLDMLQQLAAGKRSLGQYIAAVEAYEWPESVSGVQLMTLHKAKGLEYDVVYIPDINDGNIPWKDAKGKTELEEERRLLYVGMTRAKEKLVLSCVQKENGDDRQSLFWEEAGLERKRACLN